MLVGNSPWRDKMSVMEHLDAQAIESRLDEVRRSPADQGVLELIVRRPGLGEREVLEVGELTCEDGLVGDTWKARGSRRMVDGSAHPDMQLNIINARFAMLIARDPERRALAGDQLHIDLDLGVSNLPAGTRLQVGAAEIEVTDQPHTGCPKFIDRFGADAMRVLKSAAGLSMRLRGINAKVVRAGTIHTGDRVTKLSVVSDARIITGPAGNGGP